MHKNSIFTDEEQSKLIELYSTGKYSREELAQFFPGKTGKQCKSFILNHKIKSGTRVFWTKEEDEKLRSLCISGSYSYEDMSKFFPGRTRKALIGRVEKLNIRNNKYEVNVKYSFDKDYFKEITLTKAYWGGLFCADGCIRKSNNSYYFSWSTAEKDKNHIELFSKQIKSTYPIKSKFSPGFSQIKKFKQFYIAIPRAIYWKDDLNKHFGIVPNKTKRFPPPSLSKISEKLAYIKGYIDGDGSLYVSKNQPNNLSICFSSCNKDILIWIKNTFEELNIPKLRRLKNPDITSELNENCFYYSISGFAAAILYELMFKLETPKLDRKWRSEKILNCIGLCKQKPEWPNELFFQNILNG